MGFGSGRIISEAGWCRSCLESSWAWPWQGNGGCPYRQLRVAGVPPAAPRSYPEPVHLDSGPDPRPEGFCSGRGSLGWGHVGPLVMAVGIECQILQSFLFIGRIPQILIRVFFFLSFSSEHWEPVFPRIAGRWEKMKSRSPGFVPTLSPPCCATRGPFFSGSQFSHL